MDFVGYNKNDKKKLRGSSYLMDTVDPDKLKHTGTFKKEVTPDKNDQTKAPGATPNHDKEMEVLVSENLSEISANDYGLFDLKIKEIKDEAAADKKITAGSVNKQLTFKRLNTTKDGKGEDVKGEDLGTKYNLLRHLGEPTGGINSSDKTRLCKNRVDLISHLAKEENEYVLFDIVNVEAVLADHKKREAEIKEKVFLNLK